MCCCLFGVCWSLWRRHKVCCGQVFAAPSEAKEPLSRGGLELNHFCSDGATTFENKPGIKNQKWIMGCSLVKLGGNCCLVTERDNLKKEVRLWLCQRN